MADVGEFLRNRRKELDISQEDLANKLTQLGQHATKQRVSLWEKGRNRLPVALPEFRQALAAALQMPVNDLMEQLDFIVTNDDRSVEARLAADIVDRLPPELRPLALDMLRALEQHATNAGG
jgi:transcriptional regulator with XRE-family HTH domain